MNDYGRTDGRIASSKCEVGKYLRWFLTFLFVSSIVLAERRRRKKKALNHQLCVCVSVDQMLRNLVLLNLQALRYIELHNYFHSRAQWLTDPFQLPTSNELKCNQRLEL